MYDFVASSIEDTLEVFGTCKLFELYSLFANAWNFGIECWKNRFG